MIIEVNQAQCHKQGHKQSQPALAWLVPTRMTFLPQIAGPIQSKTFENHENVCLLINSWKCLQTCHTQTSVHLKTMCQRRVTVTWLFTGWWRLSSWRKFGAEGIGLKGCSQRQSSSRPLSSTLTHCPRSCTESARYGGYLMDGIQLWILENNVECGTVIMRRVFFPLELPISGSFRLTVQC